MEITQIAELPFRPLVGDVSKFAGVEAKSGLNGWNEAAKEHAASVAAYLTEKEAAGRGEIAAPDETASDTRHRLRHEPAELADQAVKLGLKKAAVVATLRSDFAAWQTRAFAALTEKQAALEGKLEAIGFSSSYERTQLLNLHLANDRFDAFQTPAHLLAADHVRWRL